jgi:hypothetical protein
MPNCSYSSILRQTDVARNEGPTVASNCPEKPDGSDAKRQEFLSELVVHLSSLVGQAQFNEYVIWCWRVNEFLYLAGQDVTQHLAVTRSLRGCAVHGLTRRLGAAPLNGSRR